MKLSEAPGDILRESFEMNICDADSDVLFDTEKGKMVSSESAAAFYLA